MLNLHKHIIMKNLIISISALLALSLFQTGAQPKFPVARSGFFGPRADTVKVWPNGAPNAFQTPEGTPYTEATLEIYPSGVPNGYCVIVCPGGGYAMLSKTHEGIDMKDWFTTRGYTFCLLNYRLPRGHNDVPLSDVQEAIRIMKGRKDLKVEHIGVLGCSAGGHLASTASTHYDAETRPEFQILFYPVISMDLSITHRGSYDGLLGENPSENLVKLYSNNIQVTRDTPPAIIFASSDDRLVPIANSLRYYEALVANGVSATMHIYPDGGHGWGFTDSNVWKTEWTSDLERWLDVVVRKQ